VSEPTLVVLGAAGQLGRALADQPLPPGWHRRAAGRQDVDITDRAALDRLLATVGPGLVVNAAAYTAVDRAEHESDLAFAINRDGAGLVAAAAAAHGLPVLQVSTDFVLAGDRDTPYDEDAAPRPLSVYGASKLAGEQAVAAANRRHVILRTAWVFSPRAACFPRTIFRLLRQQPEVAVVEDQIGNPTAAADLAAAIVTLAPTLIGLAADDPRFGLFHFAGQPALSRYDFARAVAAEAAAQGFAIGRVVPRAGDAAAAGARRPARAVLDMARITARHGILAPDWRPRLSECLRAYGEQP
jgi:dTDP-4-dehydrorhamnose reductase